MKETTSEPGRPFWRSPYFWAAIIVMITLPLLRPFLRRLPKPPPVYGVLPSFQVVDQHGRPFGLAQLKGKVTMVSLFFTRCLTVCPKLTRAMKRLQKGYAYHKMPIQLVSISIDPLHDTPKKLRAYAEKYGIKSKRWFFLTSKREQDVLGLARKGFRTAVSRPKKLTSLMEISHSGKLILVDKKGQIRGYYGISKEGINEAFHRTQHVLWERFHR